MEDQEKLSVLFRELWENYEELEKSTESTNSDSIQHRVNHSVEIAEKAVRMVNELSLFSSNESIDEIATNETRYILLPALLGYFTNKITKLDRFETVQKSQIYFIDFIRLCKLYGLTSHEVPKPYDSSTGDKQRDVLEDHHQSSRSATNDLQEQSQRRQEKIARFRRQKELEQTLADLHQQTLNERADEDTVRRYYLTLIDKWLSDVFENLDNIEAELPILEHMFKMKINHDDDVTATSQTPDKLKPALRPFIITKNDVQKAVFGLGYPSIPTVTVDEFYSQRVKDGILPAHADGPQVALKSREERELEERRAAEQKAAEAERKEDADDADTLQRARDWDDWKDDHRRGWGNTQNKG